MGHKSESWASRPYRAAQAGYVDIRGARLRMLARAEAITGRDLGYLKTFEALAHAQNEDYAEQRRRY